MNISGSTRIAAVLGYPIAHSKSPAMLNAAFAETGIDAAMIPLAVAPDDLPTVIASLRAVNLLGASITIPHKVAVSHLCHDLAPSARAIGAVNCLQLDGKRLIGHNTDAGGFVDGITAAGFDPTGKRVAILGAGGAARAIAFGLSAASIVVIARRPDDVEWAESRGWTPRNLRDVFAAADLVVDSTPIGLDDAKDHHELPLDALPAHAWVSSLIYHRETAILRDARARGLRTHDGAAMLVHQGARAFTIWTGRPAPLDVMAKALAT